MSISAALNAAQSGLTAASRTAQAVSSNVSNALTPGYGVREVALSSAAHGGVSVDAVSRRSDIGLITERRGADAAAAGADTRLAGLERIEAAIGTAGEAGSISARLGDLEARLLDAASRPDSNLRLEAAVRAAGDVVEAVGKAGATVQAGRLEADRGIAKAVTDLGTGLARVADLNDAIVRATAGGRDASSLADERHRVIDGLSEIVPLKQIARESGRVALMTGTGRILLDGDPVDIGFTGASGASPGGKMSGLTVGGREIDMARAGNQMAGGRLEALFELRDEALPSAQGRLDTLAGELAGRFGDAGLGDAAGLFVAPGDEPGRAQRLSLSAAVDPARDGAAWRLRDGMDAATPGAVGDARRLSALADALSASRPVADTSLGTGRRTLLELGDALVGAGTAAAQAAEGDAARAGGRAETLREAELAQGVNTDAEMQTLLALEKSYAANARVIQIAGSLIDRILEI